MTCSALARTITKLSIDADCVNAGDNLQQGATAFCSRFPVALRPLYSGKGFPVNTPNDDQERHENIVTVYSISEPYEAELIKNTLQDNDIQCSLDGETQGGFTGVVNIGILVKESDAKRAVELIKEHHSQPSGNEDSNDSETTE